jgi:hypothetical protein
VLRKRIPAGYQLIRKDFVIIVALPKDFKMLNYFTGAPNNALTIIESMGL